MKTNAIRPRLLCAVLVVFFGLSIGYSQDVAKKVSLTISAKELKSTLSVLAADSMEGRFTGSRGQQKAAAFIKDQFRSYGLLSLTDNSYAQSFQLYTPDHSEARIKIGSQEFINFQDFVFVSNWSSSQSLEVVLAGTGSEDDLKKSDLKNKVALVWPQHAHETSSPRLTARLKNAGASAVFIVLDVTPQSFAALGNAARQDQVAYQLDSTRETTFDSLGVFYVHHSVVAALGFTPAKVSRDVKRGKWKSRASTTPVSFLQLSSYRRLTTENIIGLLLGTDKKEEYLIISAHYDHIGMASTGLDRVYNGADDDGSGTSAVLALAKAFSQAASSGHPPRRSILFTTFTAEELGLFGSEHYVAHPVAPLGRTIVNLNIDMIGRKDKAHKESPGYVYIIGSDKISTELHALQESSNQQHAQLELDYTYNDEHHPSQLYQRSDHWNFAQRGIPIIFYFDGIHEDYHLVSDEVIKIDFDILSRRTQGIFFTAWELANREFSPKHDR